MEKKLFVKGIYSSGMVLQQNTINCIYGGGATDKVELIFRENKISASPDKNGFWSIKFNPGKAGGPFDLTLLCKQEKIVFSDVYVGEVWLSSGQSNAQLTMTRMRFSYPEEFELPENPNIRIITIPISYSFDGEKDSVENPQWKCANPQNMGELSGTSYFFAKKMQQELNVPIGIINSSQGGSPVYAWMNQDSFTELGRKDYLKRIDFWRSEENIKSKIKEVTDAHKNWDAKVIEKDKGINQKWEEKMPDTNCKDFLIPGDFDELGNKAGVVWFKKEIELDKSQAESLNSKKSFIWFGTIQDSDTIWINGVFCGSTGYVYPPRRYEIPKGTLHEGKNTITLRIQKNGALPIRFFKEKPYCIFTEDAKIHPVAFRNVEKKIFTDEEKSKGVKINLEGKWQYLVGCSLSARAGEMFFEWEPSALYNSMLAPCFSYAIAGALWYQGESNALEYYDYQKLLMKMIELWRKKFIYAPKKMPIVVMQLPNWCEGFSKEISDNLIDWAELRDAQLKAVENEENTAIVSMIDAGEWNDLHPEKKKTGGTRAAEQALRIAYGKNYSAAPKMKYCERKDNIFTVKFDCPDSRAKKDSSENCLSDDNFELKAFAVENDAANFETETSKVYGFEFITKDNQKIKAEGKLVSKTNVEISTSINADELKELRFLWKNNPDIVNLYSKELLPALPFKIIL